jgi:hypothetical protein
LEKGGKEVNRKTLEFAALILLLILLPVLAVILPKDEMATVVKLVPSEDVVVPGQPFQVDVIIEPEAGAEVAGAQFELTFNKDSVNIVSVEEGPFLTSGGASSYFNAGVIDNDNGHLTMVFGAVIGPGEFVQDPGIFAKLHCTAVNEATSSALVLSNVIVGSKDAVALPLESITEVTVVVAHSADVNVDGQIDLGDIAEVVARWGNSGDPGFTRSDVKQDGIINVLDVIVVGQNIASV